MKVTTRAAMETKRARPRARRSWCARCVRALPQFGKDLEQYKHPGWEDEYINYRMLKDILKKLEDRDEFGSSPSKDEIDGEFFQALEDELEKVNRAFVEKASEIESTLDTCTPGRADSKGAGER